MALVGFRRIGAVLLFMGACVGTPPGAFAQMTTSGAFEVDGAGGANFSIPIPVPPGTGGLEPSLNLAYNSRAGNGLLGVGWSLEGISVITRCGRTLAQDGVEGGVKYDVNDRFCMDGQRLMAVSGTYGGNGATYRTELDSFSKVTSVGSAGIGPNSFTVRTKSGLILEYGVTADSRIQAQGRSEIRVWALNKIMDTVGNYLTVTYSSDPANGEYRPLRVNYTGNAGTGLAPFASVEFIYETRSDPVYGFDGGANFQLTKRLSKVRTYVSQALVTELRLAYEISPATRISRLKTVSHCDAGGACLPPVTMTWSGGAPASLVEAKFKTGFDTALPDAAFLRFGDVNGDGLPDMVKYLPTTGQVITYINARDFKFQPAVSSTIVSGGSVDDREFYLTDLNGDLSADILIYSPNQGVLYSSLSNGDGTFAASVNSTFRTAPVDKKSHFLAIGDFNNDRYTDVSILIPAVIPISSAYTDTQNSVWLSMGAPDQHFTAPMAQNFAANNYRRNLFPGNEHKNTVTNTLQSVIINDINADGKDDIVLFYKTKIGDMQSEPAEGTVCTIGFLDLTTGGMAYLNDRFGLALGYGAPGCPGVAVSDTITYAASPSIDVNGDGAWDYMGVSSGTTVTAVKRGHGRGDATFEEGDLTVPNGWVWNPFNDLNGDGLSDLWSDSPSGVVAMAYRLRDGTYSGVVQTDIGAAAQPRWVQAVDLDGDGLLDIVHYKPFSGDIRYWRQQGGIPDRVTRFEDGTRAGVSITYASLTDLGVYAKDTDAVDPIVDVAAPIQVVRQVDLDDGIGGVRRTQYKYYGLKAERHGRGNLGFRIVDAYMLEMAPGKERTEYRQDWPYTGMPWRKRLFLPNGGGTAPEVSRVTSTFSCLHPTNGASCGIAAGKIYFPYVSTVVEQAWDLNGTAVPTVTTTSGYDRFGNATQIGISTSDGYGKTTVNTYTNDETNWLLGRLTRSEVTATAPNTTP